MAVKIRMTRMGRRHRPFYRINAVDGRTPRDGKVLERLGHYDPIEKDSAKQVVLKLERIQHWLDHGAIPSETVSEILSKQGIETADAKARAARRERARVIAKSKGKLFNKAQKVAAEKKAEAEKTAAEAEAKAAEEKAAAAAAAKEATEKAEAEESAE